MVKKILFIYIFIYFILQGVRVAQAAVTERCRYAKILGKKLFRTREIPRSGSKAEDGGEKEKERETERW